MTIEPIENGESGHNVRLKLNALIGNHWTNEEGAALRDDVQQQIAAVVETAQAAEAAAEVAGTQAVAANTVATDLRDEFDALTVGFTGSLGDALDAIAAEAQAQLDNVSQQIQTDVSDLQATVTQDLAAVQGDLAAVQGSITQIQTQQAALDQLVSEGLGEVGSDIAGLRQDVDWNDLRVIEEEDATDRILELLTGLRLNIASTDARIRDAGIYVDPAAGTVRIRGLEATQERVSQAEIEVNGVKAEVALRATVAYVNQVVSNALLDPTQIPLLDDLDLRVTQAEVRIDGQDAVIATCGLRPFINQASH